jgi:hypothetical protein
VDYTATFGKANRSSHTDMKNSPCVKRLAAVIFLLAAASYSSTAAPQNPEAKSTASCDAQAVNYKGWQAQQISNSWVKLIFVPQNGGRLMQVIFNEHPFLFVNPSYAGKYLPPSGNQWFNYGGDKLWVLPEGNDDEKHWVGNSDLLDDGPFEFKVLSQGQRCEVLLTGPADPQTGLQFSRTVSIEADSSRIKFHAIIKNATGHPIEWSVQSVSQYDTGDAKDPAHHNRNIWGFSRANPSSAYLNRYHVKFGPAENSAVEVRESGLFAAHYVPLAAELWLDSRDGWLAVVDGESRYAMVERFRYDESRQYPGKASVIFWMNGPELRQHPDGSTTFGSENKEGQPFYMEAELNSPMVRLEPGETFAFDTQWFPTRADKDFQDVTDAGAVVKSFHATRGVDEDKISLSGAFGVFFAGKLRAHLYNAHGMLLETRLLMDVDPRNPVSLQTALNGVRGVGRISLHLVDTDGVDRGSLGEVPVEAPTKD